MSAYLVLRKSFIIGVVLSVLRGGPKSIPALSFNALIIPILRIVCTISFHSFVNLLCFFSLVFAKPLYASVYVCLVVTCWERADLLALICGVLL